MYADSRDVFEGDPTVLGPTRLLMLGEEGVGTSPSCLVDTYRVFEVRAVVYGEGGSVVLLVKRAQVGGRQKRGKS